MQHGTGTPFARQLDSAGVQAENLADTLSLSELDFRAGQREQYIIEMQPIAYVHSSRKKPVDDSWNEVDSYIQLTPDYAEDCLAGLKDFSHLEVIYYFHKVDKSKIVCTSEHPRENNKWP